MSRFRFVECEEIKDDDRFKLYNRCCPAEKSLHFVRLLKALDSKRSQADIRVATNISKVIWNSEMDLCIGLRTEMDECDFIENAMAAHKELTGDSLLAGDYHVSQEIGGLAWKLEVVQ